MSRGMRDSLEYVFYHPLSPSDMYFFYYAVVEERIDEKKPVLVSKRDGKKKNRRFVSASWSLHSSEYIQR